MTQLVPENKNPNSNTGSSVSGEKNLEEHSLSSGWPRLTSVTVSGEFPMELMLNRDVLPVTPEEVGSIFKEGVPVAFSGQRSPIYELPGGVFLKGKGFRYRERDYREVEEYTLRQHKQLTIQFAREHGLNSQHYSWPLTRRFRGQSGDYEVSVPQPDGTLRRERSSARPVAAMVLDNADTEYHLHWKAAQVGFPVDLTPGYGKFPEFDFRDEGTRIPCGGFLSIIPTAYDLRIPEILLHLPYSEEISDLYQLHDVDREELLLHSLGEAGKLLFKWHAARMTIANPHFINFKIGLVNAQGQGIMQDEDGKPLISMCDLDTCQIEENLASEVVFLGNMVRDLQELSFFAGHFFINQEQMDDLLAQELDADQKYMFQLSNLLRSELGLSSSDRPLRAVFAGYFGLPADDSLLGEISPCLDDYLEVNLKTHKDLLLEMLRTMHNL